MVQVMSIQLLFCKKMGVCCDLESIAGKMRYFNAVDRDVSTSQNLERIREIIDRVGKILSEERYSIIHQILLMFKETYRKRTFISMSSFMVHNFNNRDKLDNVINRLVRSYMLNAEYYGIVYEIFLGYNLVLDPLVSKIFFPHNQVVRRTSIREITRAGWDALTLQSQHPRMISGVRVKGPFVVDWIFSDEPLDLHKNDENFRMTALKWEIAPKLKFHVIVMPHDSKRLADDFYDAYRATYRR